MLEHTCWGQHVFPHALTLAKFAMAGNRHSNNNYVATHFRSSFDDHAMGAWYVQLLVCQ